MAYADDEDCNDEDEYSGIDALDDDTENAASGSLYLPLPSRDFLLHRSYATAEPDSKENNEDSQD